MTGAIKILRSEIYLCTANWYFTVIIDRKWEYNHFLFLNGLNLSLASCCLTAGVCSVNSLIFTGNNDIGNKGA